MYSKSYNSYMLAHYLCLSRFQRFIKCNTTDKERFFICSNANSKSPLFSKKIFMCTAAPDLLDNFTENLVQKTLLKWDDVKRQKKIVKSLTTDITCAKSNSQVTENAEILLPIVKQFDKESLESFIMTALETKQFKSITSVLKKCIELNMCPTPQVLLLLVSLFARSGQKDGIQAVQSLCQKYKEEEYISQCGYLHYLAEATWMSCGNIEETLVIFEQVCISHPLLRKKVKMMIKFLIRDIVTRRGEAALVIITNFSKEFASKHRDYYLLGFLWECCFVSEWFADQQAAMNLLKEHKELRDIVKDKVPVIVLAALKQNQVEIIQRLLEVLLHFKMRKQYIPVLRALFDYRYHQGDLQSCVAIIHSSLKLEVSLPATQHQQFLMLLLSHHKGNKWLIHFKHLYQTPLTNVIKYKMKF